MFKLEQIKKSIKNFVNTGDVDNLVDIGRIVMWRPSKKEVRDG